MDGPGGFGGGLGEVWLSLGSLWRVRVLAIVLRGLGEVSPQGGGSGGVLASKIAPRGATMNIRSKEAGHKVFVTKLVSKILRSGCQELPKMASRSCQDHSQEVPR